MVSSCLVLVAMLFSVIWHVVIGVGGEQREEMWRETHYELTAHERSQVALLVGSNQVDDSTTADYASHVKKYKVLKNLILTHFRALTSFGF